MVTESPIISGLLPIKPQVGLVLNHSLMEDTERAEFLLYSTWAIYFWEDIMRRNGNVKYSINQDWLNS